MNVEIISFMKSNMPPAIYRCNACDAQFSKWAGRCDECGAWSTLSISTARADDATETNRSAIRGVTPKTVTLGEVGSHGAALQRLSLPSAELTRVLGGGIVPGSVILLAGEPGIGKSTLALALLAHFALRGVTLYASGEESAEQIAGRAARLGTSGDAIRITADMVAENLCAGIEELRPVLAVIDSIQTLRSDSGGGESGTPSAVRVAAAILVEVAKRTGVPLVLIGQVTKDGSVAGPKTLEHIVDVVLSLEGDSERPLRILRAYKNRFGRTDESGLFTMEEHGLVDLANPSEFLLAERPDGSAGSVVTGIMEGSRPLFLELQALVTKTPFQFPVRRSSGFDLGRLQMLLAILSKRAGLNFSADDVYVNVAGGIPVRDRSADLAAALAIVSSKKDAPLASDIVAIGEIGLAGEIRSAPGEERRMKEAEKLGFKNIIAPSRGVKTLKEALAKTSLSV